MAADLEPIDIEINMKQNVSEESDKVSKGMANVADSSKIVKEQIEIQKRVIADLEKQYATARAAFDKVNVSTHDAHLIAQRKQASKLFKQVRAELDAEKQGLKELEKEFKKVSQAEEKAANTSVTYMTQMRKLRQEMQELAMAGKQESNRYRELEAELARIGTAYNRVAAEQRLLTTTGSANLAGLVQGMTGLAGAFSAGQGAVSLFVKNNEELATIQTKLQAAMAITIGLQQISNTLHSTSAFRINTVTKLTNLWRNAQALLNTHLGISLALSKGLMIGGIGLLIAGIAALVYKYKEYSEKQKETNKRLEEEKALKDKLAKKNEEFANSYGKMVAAIVANRAALNSENISYNEKLRIIKKLQEQIPGYTAALSGEGNVIRENTAAIDAYLKSLEKSLKFKAAMKDLEELYTKMYELEKRPRPETSTNNIQMFDGSTFSQTDYDKLAQKHGLPNANGVSPQILETWKRQEEGLAEAAESFRDFGISKAQEEIENVKKYIESEGLIELDIHTPKSPKPKDTEKQEAKAAENLIKKTDEYQKQIDAARIAVMQEGAEKQRVALKAEYDKTKRYIEQELREIAELEKITGNTAIIQRTQLIELDSAATSEYETKLRELNEASKQAIDAIFTDAGQRFQSELDNNLLRTNQYYDNLVSEARKAGASVEQINELNAMREKELGQVRINAQLQALDFETQIVMKRMEISGKFYLFESDKMRASLQKQKQAARQRLALLEEQYKKSKTRELEEDIEEATVAIEEMDAAIRKLDTSKFQEIVGYVNQISSGLGDLFGNDSSAGKVLEWTSELADSAGKIAEGIASGNPMAIADGVFKAVSTIKDIIATDSKVRKEIREFYRELEVLATQYTISVINTIKDITGSTDSLFSTDTINNLNKGMEGFNAAVQKEKDLVLQLGDASVAVGKKKKKFLGITTGSKTVWESVLTSYKKVLNTNEELVDSSGQLNREMADALLKSGKLSTEATDLITNIVAAQDAATAAMQQVESTLSNIAGSIGDDLRTALVEAFKNGDVTAAADSFGKSASKILENWISQTMFSAVFGEMLSDLAASMKDSFGATGDQDITDDITWFMQNYQSGVDEYMRGLEKWKEQLREQSGIDIFGDGEREGTSAGLERISQDSANELNGNFYALRQQVGDIRNMQKEANLMRRAMLTHLERISENTEFCRILPELLASIEDMKARGLKVK